MDIKTVLILILSIALLGVTGACLRFVRRLLQFDELFEMLLHDLDVNIRYFDGVSDRPLLSNAQEVIEADRNMRIMRVRLEEYARRIREERTPKRRESKNPPVVA